MKTTLITLLLFLSIICTAQKLANPDDYNWKDVGTPGFALANVSFDMEFSPEGILYVAFMDDLGKASVMKFNGVDWEFVGERNFSEDIAQSISLTFSSLGVPYIGFKDGEKASVMTFNGVTWEYVGQAGFSDGPVNYLTIKMDTNDLPVVSFIDSGAGGFLSVMRYNDSTWNYVGSQGFTNGTINFPSLAIDIDNQPVVAFRESSPSGTSAMKFNGINWNYLGVAGFGPASFDLVLKADKSGILHVSFRDTEVTGKQCVMKFNGLSWEFVGIIGFSAGITKSGDITFTSDNVPYVAYSDVVYDKKVSVQRFINGNWEYVNTPGISRDSSQLVRIEADGNTPYIGYGDYSYNYLSVVKKYDSIYLGIESPLSDQFLIYPNPATDHLFITSPDSFYSVSIINSLGSTIFIKKHINLTNFKIDLRFYPSGIYYLNAVGKQSSIIKKIIINRGFYD